VKQSRLLSSQPLISSDSINGITLSLSDGQSDCELQVEEKEKRSVGFVGTGQENDMVDGEERKVRGQDLVADGKLTSLESALCLQRDQGKNSRTASVSPSSGRRRSWKERRKEQRDWIQEAPLQETEKAILRTAVESLQAIEHDSSDLLVLEGWLGGNRCRDVLIDAGASSNFVHSSWVRRNKLKVHRLNRPLEVVLADGRPMGHLTGVVDVDVAIVNGSTAPCRLVVMDTLSHDVILGMPWLRSAGVMLGCGETLTWNGKPLQLPLRLAEVPAAASGPGPELNAMKVGAAYEQLFAPIRQRFDSVFRTDLPPRTAESMRKAVHHVIRLKDPNCRPKASRERRRSPKDVQTLIDAVREMERAGLIEDSVSPWSAQAVLVAKKRDGLVLDEKRPCWDYRGVNEVTITDSQPLPLPEVMFDHLQGSKIFSKMDLLKGFWQIPLEEKTKEYLAFSTPLGLKQPRVMPFGIKNAPATFQREMQRVFKERLYKGVMVFIDDILIYAATVEEHQELVEFVLRRLQEEGYYAHPEKCEFFQESVSFLGHVVSAAGIAVQDYKVKAVKNWPRPESKTQVKSFLGLTGYYRKFIAGYSQIALSLTELTKQSVAFDWKEEHQLAFDRLKEALVQAPVLAHPDPTKPYYIHTDASGFAVSAVLSQDLGQGRQPVAFFSRKMNEAERRYPVHEQELLAIVLAMQEWRCYLYGSPHSVHILTDHRSLQWISTQPTLSQRQARWVEMLSEFSFRIEYIPGKENRVADALSRRVDYEQEVAAETQRQKDNTQPQQRLQLCGAASESRAAAEEAVEQKDDSSMSRQSHIDSSSLVRQIKEAAARDDEYQLRLRKAGQMGLKVSDGLLYTEDGILHLPDDMAIKRQFLHEMHDTPTSGHLGMNKTLRKLRQRVYWYGMDGDVLQYVRSCLTCSSTKASHQLPAGKLVPLPIPHRPWETIGLDFIGPLPKTSNFYNCILVVVDKLTKMGHFIPTNTEVTAQQVAKLVMREVIRLHGVPSNVISDRDPRFTSAFWRELWKQMGTQLRMSTAYHPQTDGQTERTNRVLEDMLRAFVNTHRTDWDEFLTPVEIAYNSSQHQSTGFTPYELNGGAAALPLDVALSSHRPTNVQAVEDLVAEVRQHLEDARLLLLQRQEAQKRYADQHRRDERYAVGDEVMLSTKNLSAFRHKLSDPYTGPFRVIEVIGDVNVKLDLPDSMKQIHPVFHVDKLKRYVRSTVEWPGREQEDRPPPVVVDGEEMYEVEKIIGKKQEEKLVLVSGDEDAAVTEEDAGLRRSARLRGRSRRQPHREKRVVVKYLVKWKGWEAASASWVAEDALDYAREAVEDYEHQQRVERGEESVAMMVVVSSV
jgi:transposase InsO family protein